MKQKLSKTFFRVQQEAGLVHRMLGSSEDNFHLNRDLNGNKADQDHKVLHKDLSNGIRIAIQWILNLDLLVDQNKSSI